MQWGTRHSLGSLGATDWLMPTSNLNKEPGGNSQPSMPHVPCHLKTPHPKIAPFFFQKINIINMWWETINMYKTKEQWKFLGILKENGIGKCQPSVTWWFTDGKVVKKVDGTLNKNSVLFIALPSLTSTDNQRIFTLVLASDITDGQITLRMNIGNRKIIQARCNTNLFFLGGRFINETKLITDCIININNNLNCDYIKHRHYLAEWDASWQPPAVDLKSRLLTCDMGDNISFPFNNWIFIRLTLSRHFKINVISYWGIVTWYSNCLNTIRFSN